MKTLAIAAVASAAAFGGAQAAVIDFDTAPGGPLSFEEVLSNQYASLGVTFEAYEDGSLVDWVVATDRYAPGGQDGYRLANFPAGDPAGRADEIRIIFAMAVDNVSFDFMPQGDEGGNVRVVASNAGGVISDNLTGIPGFPLIANYLVAGAGITQISIFQPIDDWNWGLDNLSFDIAGGEVPLPAALPLFLAGLGGLGVARRRRRA